jgi:peptide deformylase
MSVLKIVTYPDPVLKEKTKDFLRIDDEARCLVDDMLETMYSAPGVGLAAPQVGKGVSLVVMDPGPPEGEPRFEEDGTPIRNPVVLFNPKIVERSGQACINEGCLSLPDFELEVKRSERVKVEALDRDGNPITIDADGFLAIIIQHETDHLRGKLLVDYSSALKRSLYRKKRRKIKAAAKSEQKPEKSSIV